MKTYHNTSKNTNIYLIIGGSGYLGSYVVKNLLSKGKEVLITYNTEGYVCKNTKVKSYHLNLSSFKSIDKFCEQINEFEKLNVIFLAAYHHPDKIKKNPNLGFHINNTCYSYILSKLKNLNTLYYSSTDSIYGNNIGKEIFSESAIANPKNLYGKQKFIAEQITLAHGFNVIRYPFLIGPSESYKEHFYDIISKSLKEKTDINLVCDSYRNSLDFNQASLFMIDLIENFSEKSLEVINICSDEALTKYDVGVKIAESLNLNDQCLKPIKFSDFSAFNEGRAQNTIMSNKKLKDLLQIKKILLKI